MKNRFEFFPGFDRWAISEYGITKKKFKKLIKEDKQRLKKEYKTILKSNIGI